MHDPAAARSFIYANGRVLEQRVYAALFEGGDPTGVVDAVRAYRNADGGFGHGLEPDKRAPDSQPLDVEIAFERLAVVGAAATDLVVAACDWLESVAEPSGAVPLALPSIAGYPRAPHWAADHYPPDLNPTAGIAAHAHALGVTHQWVSRATDHCFAVLEIGDVPDEAHTLLGLSKLIEHAPDRARAEGVAGVVAAALPGATFMNLEPDAGVYGVTPLDFAPAPTGVARGWFDDAVIESHLVYLEGQQEGDGGWPITWSPPSEASRWEWRAIRTLQALQVLDGYRAG